MRDKCLEKPRKPILPSKTLDIIFRRRFIPNTQVYFTNRKQHAVVHDAPQRRRVRPFKVPRSEKLLSYIKYSDRKEKAAMHQRHIQPLHKKDNLKIAATRDISQRLFIKEEPDDVRAVVEIHPEFYSAIEGRPLRCHDDIKVYTNNIRNYASLRQQIGYRRDMILKKDRNINDESREFQTIYENMKSHIKNFQKFLTEDYKRACAKVAQAEKVYEDLQEKNSEMLIYITQVTLLNNMIFKLDSIRTILKVYRQYLYFAAPLYWREEFDETYHRQSLQLDEGAFRTHSGEFATDANDLMDTMDIDRIIENAKIELANPYPAHMYFQYPVQTLYLFRTMELQSREYLTQLSKTHAPYRQLQDRIKKLKASTKQEVETSQYFVDSITLQIQRAKANEVYLEQKFKRILNETFYDTVASPSSLKLRICIDFVYEQLFESCDPSQDNIHDPMKILEVMYEEFNLKLDSLDNKIVNQARNDFFAQDLKMMRDAHLAQRVLREFKEMTNAMNKAFLPPAKFTRPILKKFMDRRTTAALAYAEKKKNTIGSGERKRKVYKVSPEDREDLMLFTEWCDKLNPAPYLQDVKMYVKPTFEMNFQESLD